MSTDKRITAVEHVRRAAAVVKKDNGHANDPYVLKKVEQAKHFISKAGVPKTNYSR